MSERNDKLESKVDDFLKAENLKINQLIGQGSFSFVYAVEHGPSRRMFALKCLLRIGNPDQAARELKILHSLGGRYNVIRLFASARIDDRVLMLLEYVPFDNFSKIVRSMSRGEVRRYMLNLLAALAYIHKNGIVHCDVKPSNFLYNRVKRRYALIDFGLSVNQSDKNGKNSTKEVQRNANENAVKVCSCKRGFVCPPCMSRPKMSVRLVGTVGYRAPELIMDDSYLANASSDIWSAGVIFLSLLSGKHPFWQPEDDMDALLQIAALLGTKVIIRAAHDIGIRLELSAELPPLNLFKLFTHLKRQRSSSSFSEQGNGCKVCASSVSQLRVEEAICFCLKKAPGVNEKSSFYPAYTMLYALLNPKAKERWTAEMALKSDYISVTSLSRQTSDK